MYILFRLKYNNFESNSLSMLLSHISSSKSISEIRVGLNNGDIYMEQIGKMLTTNNLIQKLFLSDCNISDDGLRMFSQYFQGSKSLKTLSLASNANITDASIPILGQIVAKTKIEDLLTSETKLSNLDDIRILQLVNYIHRSAEFVNISSM